MIDPNKQKEELKAPEKDYVSPERHFRLDNEPVREKKEVLPEDKNIAEQIKREIELMETDETLKNEAEKKVKAIEFLGEKDKLEHLLKLAKEKGVAFAVKVARDMKDPYLLDVFHDILAKEGYYKDFAR